MQAPSPRPTVTGHFADQSFTFDIGDFLLDEWDAILDAAESSEAAIEAAARSWLSSGTTARQNLWARFVDWSDDPTVVGVEFADDSFFKVVIDGVGQFVLDLIADEFGDDGQGMPCEEWATEFAAYEYRQVDIAVRQGDLPPASIDRCDGRDWLLNSLEQFPVDWLGQQVGANPDIPGPLVWAGTAAAIDARPDLYPVDSDDVARCVECMEPLTDDGRCETWDCDEYDSGLRFASDRDRKTAITALCAADPTLNRTQAADVLRDHLTKTLPATRFEGDFDRYWGAQLIAVCYADPEQVFHFWDDELAWNGRHNMCVLWLLTAAFGCKVEPFDEVGLLVESESIVKTVDGWSVGREFGEEGGLIDWGALRSPDGTWVDTGVKDRERHDPWAVAKRVAGVVGKHRHP